MFSRPKPQAILIVIAALGTGSVTANDWPHWRGPSRNGISSETGWRDTWPPEGPKVAWKAQVGLGFSSVVVANGSAFTAGHNGDEQDTVFCFDAATGKLRWKHSYPAELGDKFFEGGTTGTPTFDGGRLYWLSRWGDTFCFKADDGTVVWNKNVQTETKARLPDWGFTGAPLVLGDRVILNVGDAGLALDRNTGAIAWQSAPRAAGYSTPLPFTREDKTWVALGSGQSYVAINPADGKEAWRLRWLTQYGVNAADPIIDPSGVFISTGYGKGAAFFKWSPTAPEEAWKSKALRSQLNAAVLYQGHLYGVDGDTTEKAALKCLELATGAEKWTHPNFGSGGLIIVDGRIIALSGRGELMVAPASPAQFKPTARTQVLGGQCWTAPVLSNGRIYCRNSRGDLAVVDVTNK